MYNVFLYLQANITANPSQKIVSLPSAKNTTTIGSAGGAWKLPSSMWTTSIAAPHKRAVMMSMARTTSASLLNASGTATAGTTCANYTPGPWTLRPRLDIGPIQQWGAAKRTAIVVPEVIAIQATTAASESPFTSRAHQLLFHPLFLLWASCGRHCYTDTDLTIECILCSPTFFHSTLLYCA